MQRRSNTARELAKRHGLTLNTARECLSALDDLLHLDRHKQGIKRFRKLGSAAGPVLLAELSSCTPDEFELRPAMLAAGLPGCLSRTVEARLRDLIADASQDRFIRKHAVRALAPSRSRSSMQFLLDLFLASVRRRPGDREWQVHGALLGAMANVADKRAVPALLEVVEEQRDSDHADEIFPAVLALGEIGDRRAAAPLERLLKKSKWGAYIAPYLCLALAKIRGGAARRVIRSVRQRYEVRAAWTPRHRKVLALAEKIASRRRVGPNHSGTELEGSPVGRRGRGGRAAPRPAGQ